MQVDVSRQMVFESPDGGKTIYTRGFASSTQQLHSEDQKLEKEMQLAMRSQRMMRIIRLAETNPTLMDALEKLEILYALVKDNENDR